MIKKSKRLLFENDETGDIRSAVIDTNLYSYYGDCFELDSNGDLQPVDNIVVSEDTHFEFDSNEDIQPSNYLVAAAYDTGRYISLQIPDYSPGAQYSAANLPQTINFNSIARIIYGRSYVEGNIFFNILADGSNVRLCLLKIGDNPDKLVYCIDKW